MWWYVSTGLCGRVVAHFMFIANSKYPVPLIGEISPVQRGMFGGLCAGLCGVQGRVVCRAVWCAGLWAVWCAGLCGVQGCVVGCVVCRAVWCAGLCGGLCGVQGCVAG